CPVTLPAKGTFDLKTGGVTETYDLPSYQSMGTSHGLTLTYSSLTADPSPIFHFGYPSVGIGLGANLAVARLVILRGRLLYEVPGFVPDPGDTNPPAYLPAGDHFWRLTGETQFEAALQADLHALSTGVYTAELSSTIVLVLASAAETVQDFTFGLVNAVDSPF